MDILHHALFVRDAAMLPVAGSVEVPPPLIGEVSAGPFGLSERDRGIAAGDWLIWWRRMLDQAVREVVTRRAEDPAQDSLTQLLARVAGRHDICDPPDFGGLSQTPELRAAAVATLPAYRAWCLGRNSQSAPGEEQFGWQLVRDAAHDVAGRLGVSLAEMDAVAHVLDVEGLWYYVAGPRCGACSVATSVDLATAPEFLGELFVSGTAAGV